jgi:adenylate kinase
MRYHRRRNVLGALALCVFVWAHAAAAPSRLRPALVFVIIGPPGSGKTVQSRLLGKKYKIPPISMSDLIQREMGTRSRLSSSLRASISSGELINDDAANELLKARVLASDAGNGFILDGYPATAGQAAFLDGLVKENGLPSPKVILLEAPDQVIEKRMLSRKRADDQPETIARRIKEYRSNAEFLISWYKSENVMRVDATQPITQVQRQIDDLIADALARKTFTSR